MWTQKAAWTASWSSRGGNFVTGSSPGKLGLQQQQQQQCRQVEVRVAVELLGVRAKVAVGGSGSRRQQQARLLKPGDGESSSSSSSGCLEFADHVDVVHSRRSSNSMGMLQGTQQKGRVVVIAGPTAVGKSRVAIALAKQLDGEIISADSIQVQPGFC